MTETEKEQWISLTAEFIQWFHKTHNRIEQPIEDCREIATNQFNAASEHGRWRHTLADLLTKTYEEIDGLHRQDVQKKFGGRKPL